jgi:protein-tyrosine phosphatase
MHPDSVLVLRGLGAEPGDFRAQQLVEALTADVDLTLTMTRAHRDEVLRLAPRGLARTYTLREAADLLDLVAEFEPDGGGLRDRALNLVKAMAEARSRRHASDLDDVPDPIGQPLETNEVAGQAIAEALLPILRRLSDLAAPAGTCRPPCDASCSDMGS